MLPASDSVDNFPRKLLQVICLPTLPTDALTRFLDYSLYSRSTMVQTCLPTPTDIASTPLRTCSAGIRILGVDRYFTLKSLLPTPHISCTANLLPTVN